ncbi:hypothetical protein D3C81_2285520 [compost metagenome]
MLNLYETLGQPGFTAQVSGQQPGVFAAVFVQAIQHVVGGQRIKAVGRLVQ